MPQPYRARLIGKPLFIRLSPDERDEIERLAASKRETVAAYVRRVLLGHPDAAAKARTRAERAENNHADE